MYKRQLSIGTVQQAAGEVFRFHPQPDRSCRKGCPDVYKRQILAGVNKACFIFLQAMGKAAESTALSMIREVVFGVGFALLLPRFFGLDGVLY